MPPVLRPSVLCRVTHSPALTVLVASLCLPGCFDGGFRFEDDSGCAPGAAGDCNATSPGLTDANTTATAGAAGTTETSGLFDTTAGGDSTGASETTGAPSSESIGTTGTDQPDESGESGDTVSTLDGTETDDVVEPLYGFPLAAPNLDHLSLSPDGKRALAASTNGRVLVVFDIATGKKLVEFNGHTGPTQFVTFLGTDSRRVLSTDSTGRPLVWDAQTGQAEALPPGFFRGVPVRVVAVSRDGEGVAWMEAARTYVGDIAGTTRVPLESSLRLPQQAAFSADRQRLYAVTDMGVATAFDTASGLVSDPLDDPNNTGVLGVDVSPDGQSLAWNTRTGVAVHSLTGPSASRRLVSHTPRSTAIRYSPDGRALLVLWSADPYSPLIVSEVDAATGAVRDLLAGENLGVGAARRSVDGNSFFVTVASGDGSTVAESSGSPDGTLRLMDTAFEGHSRPVGRAAVSPDGRTLATFSIDLTMRLWELPSGRPRCLIEDPALYGFDPGPVSWSPDSRLLFTGTAEGQGAQVFDAESCTLIRALRSTVNATDGVFDFGFSPDGRLVAVAGFGSMQVWTTDTWEIAYVLYGSQEFVKRVRFSPDGQHVLGTDAYSATRIWSLKVPGNPTVIPSSRAEVVEIGWVDAGETAFTVLSSGNVITWSAETGERQSAYSVATEEGGSLAATVLGNDTRILIAPNPGTWTVVRSADGRDLVTRRVAHDSLRWAASPDGTGVFSIAERGYLQDWAYFYPLSPWLGAD
jgi:WD40 repeat protein